MKEFAEGFKKIIYLFMRESSEKSITFIVPFEKEATRADKNGEETTSSIS